MEWRITKTNAGYHAEYGGLNNGNHKQGDY